LYTKSPREFVTIDSSRFGSAEVLLSRKHPTYRRHSRFARLDLSSNWLSLAIRAAGSSPIPPERLLLGPLQVMQALREVPGFQYLGVFLFRLARASASIRAAAEHCGSWRHFKGEFGVRLPVLLYHHVGPPTPGSSANPHSMDPSQFERQIEWLARHGYMAVRPSDWMVWRDLGTRLPKKPVVITFDDGFEDIGKYALPVLKRHGFSAGVFVVTGHLGTTNSWDERYGCGSYRLMNADHIRRWAADGIEFGAHTRNHVDLTCLSDETLHDEIQGSQEDLAALVGKPITMFAYPYGHWNPRVRAAVQTTFSTAFLDRPGLNTLGTDSYRLCRIPITPQHSLFDLFSALVLGESWLYRVRSKLRRCFCHARLHSCQTTSSVT
jgi:peptidoglycan/xylan/chitin deacetylase (PgdA/CDA1 family)